MTITEPLVAAKTGTTSRLLGTTGPIFDPLLTARECATVLQISIPTFWRWVANGTLPKAVKLGGLSRWPQSEIVGVIEHAKAKRNAA